MSPTWQGSVQFSVFEQHSQRPYLKPMCEKVKCTHRSLRLAYRVNLIVR